MDRSWRLFWWAVFASAFGCCEAALVVYVRALLGWPPGLDYGEIFAAQSQSFSSSAFSAEFTRRGLLNVELAREAATMVLLASAAMAAAPRTGRERWGLFLFVFAVWDLTYYGFLIAFIGFPRSLFATDVYFLIPWAWYGPVWFPVLVVMPALLALSLRLLTPSSIPPCPPSSPPRPPSLGGEDSAGQISPAGQILPAGQNPGTHQTPG